MNDDDKTPDPTALPAKKRRSSFPKGVSGNPAGRKPGSKNNLTLLREHLSTPDLLKDVLAKTVERAKDGDVQALKLLLDRLWPVQRSTLPAADVSPSDDTLTAQGSAVLHAMLNGQIAADVGTAMLQGLQGQAKIIESEQLAERVAELERLASLNVI